MCQVRLVPDHRQLIFGSLTEAGLQVWCSLGWVRSVGFTIGQQFLRRIRRQKNEESLSSNLLKWPSNCVWFSCHFLYQVIPGHCVLSLDSWRIGLSSSVWCSRGWSCWKGELVWPDLSIAAIQRLQRIHRRPPIRLRGCIQSVPMLSRKWIQRDPTGEEVDLTLLQEFQDLTEVLPHQQQHPLPAWG